MGTGVPLPTDYLAGARLYDWVREEMMFSVDEDGMWLRTSLYTRAQSHEVGVPTMGGHSVLRHFQPKWEDAAGTTLVELVEAQVWYDLTPAFQDAVGQSVAQDAANPGLRGLYAWISGQDRLQPPSHTLIRQALADDAVNQVVLGWYRSGFFTALRSITDDDDLLRFLLAEWLIGRSIVEDPIARVWLVPTAQDSKVSATRTDLVQLVETRRADPPRIGDVLRSLLFGDHSDEFGGYVPGRTLAEVAATLPSGTVITKVQVEPMVSEVVAGGRRVHVRQSREERMAAVNQARPTLGVRVTTNSASAPQWYLLLAISVILGLLISPIASHGADLLPNGAAALMAEQCSGVLSCASDVLNAHQNYSERTAPSSAAREAFGGALLAFTLGAISLAWPANRVRQHMITTFSVVWIVVMVQVHAHAAGLGPALWIGAAIVVARLVWKALRLRRVQAEFLRGTSVGPAAG